MKKYLIVTSILLLAAACSKSQPASVINYSQAQNQNNSNITLADLVNYFNNKFDCSTGKDPSIAKACFDQNLKSKNVEGIYDNPVYEFTDFTQDGAKDALVTIVFSGSGADGDFYALTKDINAAGDLTAGLKLNFYDGNVGYPQKTAKGYTLTCPTNHTLMLSCTQEIAWNSERKGFVITGGQEPVYSPEQLSIKYNNTKYGFIFALPASWQGYTVLNQTSGGWAWQGYYPGGPNGDVNVDHGPAVVIRNPKWTAQSPWQDIPVLVFTLKQWQDLEQGKFYIGAAPIGPTELGRNALYVFALPARYNFADAEGIQEVMIIMQNNPLKGY